MKLVIQLMHYFLLTFSLLFFGHMSSAQAWELKKEGDSIEVYTRTVANTSIKEYKVVGIVNSSSETVLNVIKDVSQYPKWIEDVSSTRTIEESDGKVSFYYQVMLPWPVKDRDLVLDMVIVQIENSIAVKLSSNPGLVSIDKNYIRIHRAEGEWLISPIGNSICRVEQTFLADPEGSIPAWVINMFIVDGPYKTLQNLREIVKEN